MRKSLPLNRRHFLGKLGIATVGLQLSEFSSSANDPAEWMMLIWCAHSIATAQERKLKFDRDYVRQMISHCSYHGIRSIVWRGSYVGKLTYPSRVGESMHQLEPDYFEQQGLSGTGWKHSLDSFNSMAKVVAEFDALKIALVEARKLGMKLYADIALFDQYFPGLENKFFDEHPQYWVLARDQKKYYRGIPCYAELEAQNYILSEIEELLARGVDGICLSLESHAGALDALGAAGKLPDEYGFNPAVVSAYRNRYRVDIVKEPFESSKLYSISGKLFTDFLRRIRRSVGNRRKFFAATMLDGYAGYGGKGGVQMGDRTWVRQQPIDVMPAYRVDLEWENWMAEGLADGLMVYAPMGNAIAEIQNGIKTKVKKYPVFLIRETDNEKYREEYQREFKAIKTGALDGVVIDEMKDYHPHPQSWCELLGRT